MATGVFPPSLPSPMGQFSGAVQSSLRTFVSETKRVRRVGFTDRMVMEGTFTWTFLPDEYAEFENWRKVDQTDGSLSFTMTAGFGGAFRSHICRFYGLPRVARACDTYRVSVDARVLTFTTGVASNWYTAFAGRPSTFPYTEVGFPEMALSATPAQNFLAVGVVPNVAAVSKAIGTNYDLSWELTGTAFEYFIEWYSKALLNGQRKFVASFGELGSQLFTVADELNFTMSGLTFRCQLQVQGVEYTAASTDYVINRAEDYTVDTWTNRAQDSAADTYTNAGQP